MSPAAGFNSGTGSICLRQPQLNGGFDQLALTFMISWTRTPGSATHAGQKNCDTYHKSTINLLPDGFFKRFGSIPANACCYNFWHYQIQVETRSGTAAMYEQSEESLEFHAVESDEQLVEFSRSSFRIRVADRNGFFLRLGSLCIPLADISIGGVSLMLDKETAMELGDIISNCELSAEDTRFSGLSGRVVHHSLDAHGRTVTGIQWLDLNPVTVRRLQVTLTDLRRRVFDQQRAPH
jgi:hypothetical protein